MVSGFVCFVDCLLRLPHSVAVPQLPLLKEYQVVPLAMIGLEDTFETWFDFPVTPILRLFGDMRKDFVLPMPKLWKIQPQKSMLVFSVFSRADRC